MIQNLESTKPDPRRAHPNLNNNNNNELFPVLLVKDSNPTPRLHSSAQKWSFYILCVGPVLENFRPERANLEWKGKKIDWFLNFHLHTMIKFWFQKSESTSSGLANWFAVHIHDQASDYRSRLMLLLTLQNIFIL